MYSTLCVEWKGVQTVPTRLHKNTRLHKSTSVIGKYTVKLQWKMGKNQWFFYLSSALTPPGPGKNATVPAKYIVKTKRGGKGLL